MTKHTLPRVLISPHEGLDCGGFVCCFFLFCDCEGFSGFFFNAVLVINLIFKVSHKEKSMFVYIKMAFTLSSYFPQIRLETCKKNHWNTTFKGFVYFWFTNKGTQYFCLCLIKAHRFSICFQTSVPTADKNITGKCNFFSPHPKFKYQ